MEPETPANTKSTGVAQPTQTISTKAEDKSNQPIHNRQQQIHPVAPVSPPSQTSSISPEFSIELKQKIEQILQKLNLLQSDFEAKIKYDSSRERMVDRLHSELQSYKDDMIFSIKKPIFIDLIKLYDTLAKSVQSHQSQPQIAQEFQEFQEDVVDILYRHSVEPFKSENDKFNPKQQQALKRVITDDQTQHLQIARRIRPGFIYENKIIRAELVTVYVYSPSKNNISEAKGDTPNE